MPTKIARAAFKKAICARLEGIQVSVLMLADRLANQDPSDAQISHQNGKKRHADRFGKRPPEGAAVNFKARA
jgi:hypothetical protein